MLFLLVSLATVNGFGVSLVGRCPVNVVNTQLSMVAEDVNEVGDGDLDSAGKVIEDLSWRVAKLRLEEQNTRRFLKARPRYLPYEDCRKWVQAWNRWDNEQDWYVSTVLYCTNTEKTVWIHAPAFAKKVLCSPRHPTNMDASTGLIGLSWGRSETLTYQPNLMSIMDDWGTGSLGIISLAKRKTIETEQPRKEHSTNGSVSRLNKYHVYRRKMDV